MTFLFLNEGTYAKRLDCNVSNMRIYIKMRGSHTYLLVPTPKLSHAPKSVREICRGPRIYENTLHAQLEHIEYSFSLYAGIYCDFS